MIKKTKNTIILLDIDDVLFDTAHFKKSELTEYRLYEDVEEVLHALKKMGEVGILSQGEHEFQIKKLTQTGIHTLFVQEHVHIVEKKDESLSKVLHKYKNVNATIYFVDDRLSGLYYAKKALPNMVTIWFRRGRYASSQPSIPEFEPDVVIDNFSEIMNVVK